MKNLNSNLNSGPMLNAYPDSIGGKLKDLVTFLENDQLKDVFQSLYTLPSVFNTDIDRGFSVIDYDLNEMYAEVEDFESLQKLGIDFKFDFILNHASVLSEQFQDILANGEASEYKDFFINWNTFWEGHGEMTEDGYIEPTPELIKDMFFRKPGLPFLNVRMPDGKEVPYWNTFYQEVNYSPIDAQDLMCKMDIQYSTADAIAELVNRGLNNKKRPEEIDFGNFSKHKPGVVNILESNRKYLGQMDLNIKSPLVWAFYDHTLKKLSDYGAQIVRLDAFAYAPKEPGLKNFLNDPGTWDLLSRVKELADTYNLTLLPEIHAQYGEKIHEKLAEEGYMTYDFFLPGLLIDAFERNTKETLVKWMNDIQEKGIKTVNMLGSHDGIPLLDLKGLLPDALVENLIKIVVSRGGYVKDLHGKKNIYYQVNATYFSALGEDEKKLLLARAIQLFMPGKPQVWYLDLFAGKNNHEAVEKAGVGGHKEINRTNLTLEQVNKNLGQKIVQDQLDLLRFRNTCQAFGFDAKLTIENTDAHILNLCWENNGFKAELKANLKDYNYTITATNLDGSVDQIM